MVPIDSGFPQATSGDFDNYDRNNPLLVSDVELTSIYAEKDAPAVEGSSSSSSSSANAET